MPRYLMTHSLLSSWLYCQKENPYEDQTNARDPIQDFLTTLNREKAETAEAMRKGIDFEDLVVQIVNDVGFQPVSPTWYDAASQVANIITGSQLQHKARREITVGDKNLVLYGRLDALCAGVVYDIKFSGSYDKGKFFTSTQHPVYMELIPEAYEFQYLVSNGTYVWTETYRRDETPSVYPIIQNFFSWLKAQGLMKIYEEKWLAL